MANEVIRIEGLSELSRAFRHARTGIAKDLRSALESSAEPVRADAQTLALSSIRRIGTPWSRMRVGVTQSMVYVAPIERGVKRHGRERFRRPNLARLLRDRAMQPAFAQNRDKVVREVEDTLADLARTWSRV